MVVMPTPAALGGVQLLHTRRLGSRAPRCRRTTRPVGDYEETAMDDDPRSSPASFRSTNGTMSSAIRLTPTLSSTASSTTPTAAHSRDGDQAFQAMVITDSSDRDQLRRRTRLTALCVLEMASWSRLAGWFGDRPGGPWEGPVRDAKCPHERRSGARGRGLWAGGAIGREAIMVFSFRRPDGAGCRL